MDFGDGYEGTSTTPTITISIKTRNIQSKTDCYRQPGASSSFTATIKVTSATGTIPNSTLKTARWRIYNIRNKCYGVVVNTTEKAFKGERGLKWTVTSEGEGTAELKLDGGTIVVPVPL